MPETLVRTPVAVTPLKAKRILRLVPSESDPGQQRRIISKKPHTHLSEGRLPALVDRC